MKVTFIALLWLLLSAPALAVITQVGNASYISGTPVTSASFSGLPATQGDIQDCVLTLSLGSGATITPPAGYSLVDRANAGDAGGLIATYRATTNLVANPTFTFTSSKFAGVCVELSGVSTTLDAHSALQDNGSTNTNVALGGTAITPTKANDRFLAFYTLPVFGSSNTFSAGPSGFTEMAPAGGTGSGTTAILRAFWLDNPALSSLAPTITWGQANDEPGFAYIAEAQAGSAVASGGGMLLLGAGIGGGGTGGGGGGGGGGTAFCTESLTNLATVFNGSEWPLGYCPYSIFSPFKTVLPTNPANVDSTQTTNLRTMATAGSGDDLMFLNGRPVYVGRSTDPNQTIHCTTCNFVANNSTIHAPAGMITENAGSDFHVGVIDVATGNEYDFYNATISAGTITASIATLVCGNGTVDTTCSSPQGTLGYGVPAAFTTTTDLGALAAGTVRYNEVSNAIANGNRALKHAVILVAPCTNQTASDYPAQGTFGGASICSDGGGIHMGALVHLRMTNAQVDALGLESFITVLAKTLILYGGYVSDFGGNCVGAHSCGVGYVVPENGAQQSPDPTFAFASAHTGIGCASSGGGNGSCNLASLWTNSTIAANLEVLSTCYARQNCSDSLTPAEPLVGVAPVPTTPDHAIARLTEAASVNIRPATPSALATMQPLLTDIGIKHVRGTWTTSSSAAMVTAAANLCLTNGIASSVSWDYANNAAAVTAALTSFVNQAGSQACVDFVEPPNEMDNGAFSHVGCDGSTYTTWQSYYTACGPGIYSAIKTAFPAMLVAGPTLTNELDMYSNAQFAGGLGLGNLRSPTAYADVLPNLHPYPSGDYPGQSGKGNNPHGGCSNSSNLYTWGLLANYEFPGGSPGCGSSGPWSRAFGPYVWGEWSYTNDNVGQAATYLTDGTIAKYTLRRQEVSWLEGVSTIYYYQLFCGSTNFKGNCLYNQTGSGFTGYDGLAPGSGAYPVYNAVKDFISFWSALGTSGFSYPQVSYALTGSAGICGTVGGLCSNLTQGSTGRAAITAHLSESSETPGTGVASPGSPVTEVLTVAASENPNAGSPLVWVQDPLTGHLTSTSITFATDPNGNYTYSWSVGDSFTAVTYLPADF